MASQSPHVGKRLAPIVFVHGLKGSRLVGPDGSDRWVTFGQALFQRQTHLELPLTWSSSALQDLDDTSPHGALRYVSRIVPIYERALTWMTTFAKSNGRELIEFSYDWRRAPSEASMQLLRALKSLPGGKAHVVAHSLGAAITLHAMRMDPSVFSSVLFAGAAIGTGCGYLEDMTPGTCMHSKILDCKALFSFPSSYIFFPVNDGKSNDGYEGSKDPDVCWGDADDWVKRKLSVFGHVEATPERVEHLRKCLALACEFRKELDRPFTEEELTRMPPTKAIVGVGIQTRRVHSILENGTPVAEFVDGDGRIATPGATPPNCLCSDVYKVRVPHMNLLDDGKAVAPILASLIQEGEGTKDTHAVSPIADK